MLPAVPASEMKSRFSEYLDQIEQGRLTVTKHGRPKAVLISSRELESLEETLAILEDQALLADLKQSLAELRSGLVRDADGVFAELDAQFTDG